MYLKHFGFTNEPFGQSPDADMLFLSKGHLRAKAYMEYFVLADAGIAVLTGDIGAGKTTLIHRLLADLPEHVLAAKMFQAQLTDVEFLQSVLAEFGLQNLEIGKIALINRIKQFLLDCHNRGQKTLLIIDEAQGLERKTLEEIRMLSGLEQDRKRLLNIILVGQPELADKINAPDMEQLRQRLRFHFHLLALSDSETKEYIRHRLHLAGGKEPILTEDALDKVFYYTGGVPRLINTLCDMALLTAYVDDRHTVDQQILLDAVKELNWVPYEERPRNTDMSNAHEVFNSNKLALADADRLLWSELNNHIKRLSDTLSGMASNFNSFDARLKELERKVQELPPKSSPNK
jgi:type II secretory pathway predicted ATPase ExeA